MATVLIVDDSWLTRRFVIGALQADGTTLLEAENGEDALTVLEKEQVDCLVLDLLMPGMDGFAVMEALQKQKSTVPVIVLTADIQQTTHDRCNDLGAFRILVKPSNQEDIKLAVDDALESKRGGSK